MDSTEIHVLLIEDNPADTLLLEAALEATHLDTFELTSAEGLEAGLNLLNHGHYDVALLDLGLPDSQGLETFTKFQTQAPDMPVIVFSGNMDEQNAIQAVRAGAQDYMIKGQATWDMAARMIRYGIERQRLRKSLQESEKRFSTVFQASPALQIITDADGKILDANEAFCRRAGYNREELVGHTTIELGLWSVPQDEQKISETLLLAGHVREIDINFNTRYGETGTMLASLEPIDLNGEKCIISTGLDITERKQAEAALRESLGRFHALFEASPEAIMLIDPQGNWPILDCNSTACEMNRYTREELVGQSIDILNLTPGDQVERDGYIKQIQKTGILRMESFHRRKDGSIFPIEISTSMISIGGRQVILGIDRDITERKQAEEALRLSEERYRTTLDNMLEGCQIIDFDWHYTYVNDAAARQGHATREKMLYHTMMDLYPGIEKTDLFAVLRNCMEKRVADLMENEFIYPDGSRGWFDLSIEPMQDGIFILSEDITARKHAEAALRTSEEKYRGLLESLDSVVAMVDYDGKFLYLNDMATEQLDSTSDQLTGKTMCDLFPEPIASQQLENIRKVITEDQGKVFENITNIKGQPRWYRTSIQPLHDDAGQAAYALINSTDIHGLKTTQQALQELNRTLEERIRERTAQYRNLYDTAPVGYHSLDAEGKYIEVNQTELDWLGYSRDELIGKHISFIFTPEYAQKVDENFKNLKANGKLNDLEMLAQCKDKTTFPVMVNAIAILDENGQYVSIRSTMTDITERKKAENALRLANAEMEQAMRLKDNFLANISHELRTPLTGVLGLSESLLLQTSDPLTERQHKYLSMINASGQHLLSLINDILDLSKIDAGKVEIDLDDVSVGNICASSLAFVKELAVKKRINLNYHCDPKLISMVADGRRLKQILVNLLGNAIKFTPNNGKVSLDVQADPRRNLIHFAVIDTGIGISAKDLRSLFQPFTQVDSSLSRQHEGSGLGLVLVKKLTEMHAGMVDVESEVGKGSRFTVTLPWHHPPKRQIPPPQAFPITISQSKPAMRKRILLAEDNEVNASVVKDFLTQIDFEVKHTRDGNDVFHMISQFHPDLLLVDIQMPNLDGLAITRRVRQMPEFKKIPIVAVTAMAMKGDRERCVEAGVNEYLMKPFSLNNLAQVINTLLHES